MDSFKWLACLSAGKQYDAILKEREEDFIVREGGPDGRLLNVGEVVNRAELLLLEGLPLIPRGFIKRVLDREEIVRHREVLGKIVGIPDKEGRQKVHQLYSMHPFVYTKTIKNQSGSTDILVLFDTHHKQHIYSVCVTKKGRTSHEAIKMVASLLRVAEHDVMFAGNKDKKGITTQRISVAKVAFIDLYKACHAEKKSKDDETLSPDNQFATREVQESDLPAEDIVVVEYETISAELDKAVVELAGLKEQKEQSDEEYLATVLGFEQEVQLTTITRIHNRIGLGDLSKNRFYLRLKVSGDEQTIHQSVVDLKTKGFPNYYGRQRFGYNMNNSEVGKLLLDRKFDEALDTIIQSLSSLENSTKVQDTLACIREGKLKEASLTIPPKFHTEKQILRGLSRGVPPKQIFQMIRRENRMIYMHSYQSMLFNDMLESRLKKGLNPQEYTGGRLWVGSITSQEEIHNHIKETSTPDLDTLFLPLFPKPAAGSPPPPHNSLCPKGGYRKAIIHPENLTYSLKEGTLSLSFDLPPGTYATMVIKEITKNGTKEVTW
ncbi:tRNA pseudouridine13 synthase [Nematocida homosporus]|uniref:tRNA pseudouridine13 synthase n=1 Tax=Nematocida homosporus TaxID=1912981 RepID=UPI00221E4339|nr:tRNA pseudouridine13 synthase [Nematocida homosporus]KAI5184953.1 tRNA pseudouridine13 synthase [Nematocida homosporus]